MTAWRWPLTPTLSPLRRERELSRNTRPAPTSLLDAAEVCADDPQPALAQVRDERLRGLRCRTDAPKNRRAVLRQPIERVVQRRVQRAAVSQGQRLDAVSGVGVLSEP